MISHGDNITLWQYHIVIYHTLMISHCDIERCCWWKNITQEWTVSILWKNLPFFTQKWSMLWDGSQTCILITLLTKICCKSWISDLRRLCNWLIFNNVIEIFSATSAHLQDAMHLFRLFYLFSKRFLEKTARMQPWWSKSQFLV